MPFFRWAPIVLSMIATGMVAWSMSDGWPLGLAIFRNVFWIAMAGVQITLGVPIGTWQAVRGMRKADPEWAEEQTIELDDAGIRLASPSSQLALQWSELRRAVETRHTLLLYIGTKIMFIPLRAATAAGVLQQLRELVERKLGRAIDQRG